MSQSIRWGILATGTIARTFARGLARSSTGRLVAVASRSQAGADAFAAEYPTERAYGSYEQLLADPAIDAVYIAVPHTMHARWAIRSAEAGKHILCEKPLGVNHAEALAIIEAARRHDVFLMEAFMYRCHPQIRRTVALIRAGAVGEVRVIDASFSFNTPFDPASRLFDAAFAGGGILDVGCYPVSAARLIAGAALQKDFLDPIDVTGMARIGASGVDEYALAELRFPGDILARVACGMRVEMDNVVRIHGSEGSLLIPEPWLPAVDGGPSRLIIRRNGGDPDEIVIDEPRGLYTIEADTVAAHMGQRQAAPPAMSHADTLGNMRVLDRWREVVGLVYPFEKSGAPHPPP